MRHHSEVGKMYGEAYSTSLLWGTEREFSSNFIVCGELVAVNVPVQEKDAICRIVAGTGMGVQRTSSLSPIKNRQCCLSRWRRSNDYYDVMTSMHDLY